MSLAKALKRLSQSVHMDNIENCVLYMSVLSNYTTMAKVCAEGLIVYVCADDPTAEWAVMMTSVCLG